MNKYLYILGLVGTAFLSACSSDDLTTVLSPEEERALVVEAGMDSDIPITLGSLGNGRALTRSPLESTDFQISGGNLSVYCLATGIQAGSPNISAIPASADDIVWNDPNKIANWLVNKPAIVSYYNGTGASPIPGVSGPYSYIQFWKDGNVKERFYPFGNWYSYDFFAYYPRVGDANTSYSDTGKSCFANITIDGSKDVIWGHASGSDEGFSAKYMRLNPTTVPEFVFNHLLTQLVFYVRPHDESVSQLQTDGIKVSELKMKEVYKKLKLIVASKEPGLTSGEISELSAYGDVSVWNGDTEFSGGAIPVVSASYDPDDESTHKTYIGYAMVPPSALIANKEYNKFAVKLKVEDGSSNLYYNPADENVDENGYRIIELTGTFLAGHKYEIILDIY